MMLKSTINLVAAAIFLIFPADAIHVSTIHPTASRNAQPLNVSSSVLTLSRRTSNHGGTRRSAASLLGLVKIPSSKHVATLSSIFNGTAFGTEITIGKEKFEVLVDTGSSDTWIVEPGFQCVDLLTSTPEPEDYCSFGPTYNVSKTFDQISNENFNIAYEDGAFLTGIIGTESVTLAGLKVKQNIGLANRTGWLGDGVASGIIGLAYPDLTSAYAGTDPSLDSGPSGKSIPYSPIFETMVSKGLIPDLFSLALLRDTSGPAGYFALGGLSPQAGQNYTLPLFYTINIDSILLKRKSLAGSGGPNVQYIIDSGTTLNYLPTPIANAFNAAFNPPAVYSATYGVYIVACNAKAPALDIVIGGTKFDTNPLDLIFVCGS